MFDCMRYSKYLSNCKVKVKKTAGNLLREFEPNRCIVIPVICLLSFHLTCLGNWEALESKWNGERTDNERRYLTYLNTMVTTTSRLPYYQKSVGRRERRVSTIVGEIRDRWNGFASLSLSFAIYIPCVRDANLRLVIRDASTVKARKKPASFDSLN